MKKRFLLIVSVIALIVCATTMLFACSSSDKFEGKTYDIGNRLEWLKTSIEFAMDDPESKKYLLEYMKQIIDGA